MLTNDAQHEKEQLVCEGMVKVPFNISPSIVSFGRIDRDAGPMSKTVKITRGDGGPLALDLSPINHPNVEAKLRELTAGDVYELDISIKPPWPVGSLRTDLVVRTGIKESPQQKINVYAQMAPRLTTSPSRFTVPSSVKADLDLTVRLIWSGGEAGKILSTSTTVPKAAVSVEELNNQQLVKLRIPAGYEPRAGTRAYVVVNTDDKSMPTLRIPVYVSRAPQTTASAQERARTIAELRRKAAAAASQPAVSAQERSRTTAELRRAAAASQPVASAQERARLVAELRRKVAAAASQPATRPAQDESH
ncbi:MAG: hypothetical protein KKB50_02925 [Planctomycetes bacterium]|nr:hypothetical protein [Planctomycetota bacterium]